MLSLRSYSQIDIANNQDTTKVILSTRTARLAFQDLIRYDGLKLIDKQKDSIILFKDSQIDLFKQKDLLKDQKISNLETIILKKDEQFSLEREKSNSLLKELKGARRKTLFYKIGTFAGVLAITLLIVK